MLFKYWEQHSETQHVLLECLWDYVATIMAEMTAKKGRVSPDPQLHDYVVDFVAGGK